MACKIGPMYTKQWNTSKPWHRQLDYPCTPAEGCSYRRTVGRSQIVRRSNWANMDLDGKHPLIDTPSGKAWYWPTTWMYPLQVKSDHLQGLKILHHIRCSGCMGNTKIDFMNPGARPISEPPLSSCLPIESSRNDRGEQSEHLWSLFSRLDDNRAIKREPGHQIGVWYLYS